MLTLLQKRINKLRRSIEKHQFDYFFNRSTVRDYDLILATAEAALLNRPLHENTEA